MALEARNVSFRYTAKGPEVLRGVSLAVEQGERVALLGPSGYGKSTLARLLAGYERPAGGQVLLDGAPLPRKGVCPVQLIFQHPEQAVNPRWKMRAVLAEAGGAGERLLADMGVDPAWLDRYPRELSGGELQRFCVVRALCASPRFLIADEISAMLDVITQAQMWELLLRETEKRGLGLLVITHNRQLAQRVCTRLVEVADMAGTNL